MKALEGELEALLIGNSAFDELESALDVFCPFEAVGMVKQEIRHGYFLSNILDPQRPHGFGSQCLKAFMAAVAKSRIDALGGPSTLDVHLKEFDVAEIRREWRNIDILIHLPAHKMVVAIELKIDSAEHGVQLAKYKKIVEGEWPEYDHLFVFLSKRGDEPSDEAWLSVEIETLAVELDRVAKGQRGGSQAQAMLAAYLNMLRRHHLTNDRLEELAARLWTKHKEALEFLADRRPNVLSDAMSILIDRRDSIAKKLSETTGLTVVTDSIAGASALRFGVADWDALPDMCRAERWTESKRFILAELKAWRGEVVSAYVVLGRGDQTSRQRIFQRLLRERDSINRPDKLSPDWKRLNSKTLIRLKDEDDLDSEVLAGQLEAGFVKAVSPALKAFDRALQFDRESNGREDPTMG